LVVLESAKTEREKKRRMRSNKESSLMFKLKGEERELCSEKGRGWNQVDELKESVKGQGEFISERGGKRMISNSPARGGGKTAGLRKPEKAVARELPKGSHADL